MSAPANRRRGEVAATLAGRPVTLCLTLGSLAELEAAFGASDLPALAERFGRGRLAAADIVRLLGAGLRGAGRPVTDEEVRALPAAALPEAVEAVAALLAATFPPESTRETPPDPPAPQAG